jgi:hypothetical protein
MRKQWVLTEFLESFKTLMTQLFKLSNLASVQPQKHL